MMALTVPSSARSHEAVNKVRPKLERELKLKGLAYGSPIFIRLFKKERQLELWIRSGKSFHLFSTYRIQNYGRKGVGPKTREGDGMAPEGFYEVHPAGMNPLSDYHLAFNIGYPNSYDRAKGMTGHSIMIHGRSVSIGCFAMGDDGIEEIYALADGALRNGQQSFMVHSFPFRMNDAAMIRHSGSRWIGFWQNLKEGYDLFENKRIPAATGVRHGRYVFW